MFHVPGHVPGPEPFRAFAQTGSIPALAAVGAFHHANEAQAVDHIVIDRVDRYDVRDLSRRGVAPIESPV